MVALLYEALIDSIIFLAPGHSLQILRKKCSQGSQKKEEK
jgi:hypothetical protein